MSEKMKLVLIAAPCDYIHKGKEFYVNPIEVSSVGTNSAGTTFVKMKNGDVFYSHNCASKVVSDLEQAMSPETP